ncbi:MAG: 4-(cytidine 5'-diphospho)-2-C-methyl-D-erythritol kinase [Armatimonadetes bacterium]|nr:4-(cytidine 5'-diphospho)-2-C-methyl-D-erythritol kinase [Armatimonadota bacterium]
MRQRWITLRANAKLNLCLEVVGRRADGYHDIATVFQAISVCDGVRVELGGSARGLKVLSDGWPAPRGVANLCWKAAVRLIGALSEGQTANSVAPADGKCGCRDPDLLVKAPALRPTGLLHGTTIRLIKRLPPGGGLGGGSSNAAAVLVGLNYLLGRPLAAEVVQALAAGLGSDVAFFASGAAAALAGGRGEQLQPLPAAQDFWAVVAWPGAPVSTAWAYGQLCAADFGDGRAAAAVARAMRAGEPLPRPDVLRNAFLRSVVAAREDVGRLMETVAAVGAAAVSLAGSGACVWGLFADRETAETAAQDLRRMGLWASAVTSAPQGVEIADVSG